MLCLFGVLLVGLAGTQFTLPFALPNTERIDLRLLVGFLAVLAGCMGSYCVGRHHGGIVIKTLYIVVIVVGLGTTGFYAFTTYRVLIGIL
jgi:hypothetical protein